MLDTRKLKSAIESILFISDKPVTLSHLKGVFEDISEGRIESVIKELQGEYEAFNRGFRIQFVAGGYRMSSDPDNFKYIKRFLSEKRKVSLSLPALECLALIAYKQPITIPDINNVRNIDSGAVVKNLLSKGLIKIVGRKDAPGRPFLYGTTKEFLVHFGIEDLQALPPMEEIRGIFE